jgi:hypothetical protein
MKKSDFKIGEIVEVRYSFLNSILGTRVKNNCRWRKRELKEKDFEGEYINYLIYFKQIRKVNEDNRT